MARTVTILNLAKLDKKLRRLPEAAVTSIRAAMEAGAIEIVAMMKRLAPEDSGDLRDSIGWTWGKKPKYAQAIAVAKSKLGGQLTITIYAGNERVRYAHLVEFATAPHINGGMFPGTQHPGTKAQPFFFVSWRALRRPAKTRINKAIRTSVKKVAAA
ncbi:MAG: HK97 gp10 family phage protein [Ferrovibrio sp.]|uniref:HK97 gp10 family phage protein n=1 Tax=Ferrovibrio sp. TaxID=1917215 RepID=UPI00262DF5C3|nr:HK97 gp10 family phage protein [Ferrovibrio sp.]MCW0235278.1 HK97 gp10 family phage protein [Ferrovibrio sp.]